MSTSSEYTRICPVDSTNVADLIRIGQETNLSPWSADSYLQELKNPNGIILRLVTNENETIGFIVGRLVVGGEIEARADAEIYNIGVSEASQRNGYGQLLLDSFFSEALSRGVSFVWLEVRESNAKAIEFYRKNGFETVQTRPGFYQNPREAALLMRLKLRSK